MNKKEKEAVRLVLEELTRRLPKTKKHGFMLEESSDVSKAFEYLIEQVSVPSKSKEQKEPESQDYWEFNHYYTGDEK